MHPRPTPLILAALLLLLPACGQAAPDAPAATARCGPVEFPQVQFGSHLIGDAAPPVPYSSTPPTSGWHQSGLPPVGIFTDAVPETRQVSALEAGGVVVTHNGLAPQDVAALADHVRESGVEDQVVVTPYGAIDPGEVVLASWGALQRCEGLDLDALDTYVAAYGNPIEQVD